MDEKTLFALIFVSGVFLIYLPAPAEKERRKRIPGKIREYLNVSFLLMGTSKKTIPCKNPESSRHHLAKAP